MGDRKNSPERLKIEIASLTEDRDYYERKAKERKLELQVVRAKRKSAVILARKRKPASLRAVDCERADAAEARVRLLTREIESLQRGNLLASVARIPVVPVSYNRIAA